jgi:hypothetical protein
MNFLDIKAGEPIEVGTQKAYRFWRYVFPPTHRLPLIMRPCSLEDPRKGEVGFESQPDAPPPHHTPVRLLSCASDTQWYPGQPVEGTTPDEGEQGIHGFKTLDDLFWSFCSEPEQLVIRSQISGCDGVVFGTIEMWGIIWNHAKGYRAQFARPLSFVSSYGNRSEQALAELRAIFSGKAEL